MSGIAGLMQNLLDPSELGSTERELLSHIAQDFVLVQNDMQGVQAQNAGDAPVSRRRLANAYSTVTGLLPITFGLPSALEEQAPPTAASRYGIPSRLATGLDIHGSTRQNGQTSMRRFFSAVNTMPDTATFSDIGYAAAHFMPHTPELDLVAHLYYRAEEVIIDADENSPVGSDDEANALDCLLSLGDEAQEAEQASLPKTP